MTDRQTVCLHADSNGDVWSLQAGKGIVKPKFDVLPASDFWVVGFPSNYAILTELYFDTVRRYSANEKNLSSIYVGSVFPWRHFDCKSKDFLYDVVAVPPAKRQASHWHLLDDASISTYLLAKSLYDASYDMAEVAWQNHCLAPVFSRLGCDADLDPAMFLVADILDPRWFMSANGSFKALERYFGLQKKSHRLADAKFFMLSDAVKAIPSNSFLHAEAEARNPRDKLFALPRLFLHFFVRHWLSSQTRLSFFDPSLFFKSQKAKQMYMDIFDPQ
jgi:hypothetical protein